MLSPTSFSYPTVSSSNTQYKPADTVHPPYKFPPMTVDPFNDNKEMNSPSKTFLSDFPIDMELLNSLTNIGGKGTHYIDPSPTI